MIWINKNKRMWRTAVLTLLLIAIIGPWSFDKIHVPAEYACLPAVRLEGDFCGIPLSGLWIFTAIIGNVFGIIARLVTGAITFTNITRELIFSVLYLFLVLPFFTTLLLISGKEHRFWLQRLYLDLAVMIALIFWGLSSFSIHPLKLWGLWLYMVIYCSDPYRAAHGTTYVQRRQKSGSRNSSY